MLPDLPRSADLPKSTDMSKSTDLPNSWEHSIALYLLDVRRWDGRRVRLEFARPTAAGIMLESMVL